MSKNPPKAAKAAAEPSPALVEIIACAHVLSRYRAQLALIAQSLNDEIEQLKARKLPEIRSLSAEAGAAWSELETELKTHPELFVSPRSLEAHGIKFGYAKGKGGLDIADADRTVELIKRHLPDQVGVLISVREAPVKDALAQLSAAELKKVGVEVKGTGDVVFIKPAEGAVDKLVKALVAAAVEGE